MNIVEHVSFSALQKYQEFNGVYGCCWLVKPNYLWILKICVIFEMRATYRTPVTLIQSINSCVFVWEILCLCPSNRKYFFTLANNAFIVLIHNFNNWENSFLLALSHISPSTQYAIRKLYQVYFQRMGNDCVYGKWNTLWKLNGCELRIV